MKMNVPVPFLVVKCYFIVRETLAEAPVHSFDATDSVTPVWNDGTSSHRSHNPLTQLLVKHYKS